MKIGRQDDHPYQTLIIALEDWKELRQFILVLLPARGPPDITFLTALGASESNTRIGFNHSLCTSHTLALVRTTLAHYHGIQIEVSILACFKA